MGQAFGGRAASLCRDVALPFLDEPAVAEYLAARFGRPDLPRALARRLHHRTDGHPLFLVHVVDDLVEHGVLSREAGGGWRLAGEDHDAGVAGIPVMSAQGERSSLAAFAWPLRAERLPMRQSSS